MKGFIAGISVTAPVAIIMLYFVLNQTKDLKVEMKQDNILLEIREAKFDKDWEEFDSDFSGDFTDIKEHTERIDNLKKKYSKLDGDINQNEESNLEEINQIKDSIEGIE